MRRLRLLVLGGASVASALARRLADMPGVAPILSLAGATANPAPSPIPRRIGGFSGADGLAAYLRSERIDALIDATHPFAERMSANAVAAAQATATPLVVFARAPWTRQEGDDWTEVDSAEEAVDALGPAQRTVFLTLGRLQLAPFLRAPQHLYIVRAIDKPAEADALPRCKLILARGPFALDDELRLMRAERIEALVTKNSGGQATYPKIEAARALGIFVVIVRRRKAPEADTLFRLDDVIAWIEAHRGDP